MVPSIDIVKDRLRKHEIDPVLISIEGFMVAIYMSNKYSFEQEIETSVLYDELIGEKYDFDFTVHWDAGNIKTIED